MKLALGKYGLKEDPRRRHVAMTYGGRDLLGEVVDAYRDEVTGAILLHVKHFNGEAWPINPSAFAVEVIG